MTLFWTLWLGLTAGFLVYAILNGASTLAISLSVFSVVVSITSLITVWRNNL